MSDVKDWAMQNKLKLNEDKTEAMVLGKPSVLAGVSILYALDVACCHIALSSSVKGHGVTDHPVLSMKQHIINVCKVCYYQICLISKLRKYLDVKSATALVSCFVLSRLDYCNVLLSGLPLGSINKWQKVQIVLHIWC